MCQSKQNGGKRCFAHHWGTKASLSYIHAKTGVDKTQIYAIMKELNKEGRKLNPPSEAELENYFKLEEFKTKYDTQLPEKEKLKILKQLLEAKAEAEDQGVTGGAYHAWKNGFKRTVDRLKKPLVAATLAGTMLFSVAGCAGAVTDPPKTDDNSTPPANSQELLTKYGDVMPGETREDALGKWQGLKLNPDSEFAKYDSSKVDMDSLKEHGFTEDDAKEAHRLATNFIIEQVVDSTDTDKPNAEDWTIANINLFDTNVWDVSKEASTINVVNAKMPKLIRDGGPRVEQTFFKVNRVNASGSSLGGGESFLFVTTEGVATYKTTDKDATEWIMLTEGLTEEEAKVQYPELSDEIDTSLYTTINYTIGYSKKKNDFGIVGVNYVVKTHAPSNVGGTVNFER